MESDGPEIGALNELDLQPPESKSPKSSAFHATLTQIQGKPLSPDNINTYASDALADLIKLTDSIIGDYAREQPSDAAYGKELEDKAFEHFGLGNLGNILNYVASKELELGRIDELIEKVENTNTVIVPPNGEIQLIQENDGSFGKKSIISRTKTLLFILSNDFNVNIEDPNELTLRTGVLSGNMMRKLSYFLINVPKLKRTILSCDEEGNVTYIFDDNVLKAKGISPENLASFTKDNINDLLQSDPNLGRRIVYTGNFVPRMIRLIDDLKNDNDTPDKNLGHYLYPKAPEGVLSRNGLLKKWHISFPTIDTVAEELGESLGVVNKYRFGSRPATGYTQEQQEMIRLALKRKGTFSKMAPEGILSKNGMVEKFGVSSQTIRSILAELGENFVAARRHYKFGNRMFVGYTKEQLKIIEQALERRGLLSEMAHAETLSAGTLAKKLKVDHSTVINAIKELGDILGETHVFKFGGRITTGYNLGQQEMIRKELERRGLLSEVAPDETLTVSGLAKKLHTGKATLKNIIKELGDSLGETQTFKFGGYRTAIGYTEEQQEKIRQELERRRGY